MRKITIVSAITLLSAIMADGQSYNPYVTQGVITPATLNDAASNGVGQLSFEIGNSGDALPLVPNQEMVIILSLSRGVPNNVNPLTALSGNYSGYFNWLYDPATYTYQGVQNQTIPSNSSGYIHIDYKVISNSEAASPQNGFNVNITPPPYTNGLNDLLDDQQSAYAFTQLPNTYNPLDPTDTRVSNTRLNIDLPLSTKVSEEVNGESVGHQNLPINLPGKLYEDQIRVFPNPAIDYFNIHIKSVNRTKYSIKVSDVRGQVVIVTEADVDKGNKILRVSTETLASGMYNVMISGGKETKVSKIEVIK